MLKFRGENYLEKRLITEFSGWEFRAALDAFQLVLRVLLLTLINGLVVIGGLLLFILPGVYLASRLLLSPYFLILEGKGVLESLDLSWQTTKTNQKNYLLYLQP